MNKNRTTRHATAYDVESVPFEHSLREVAQEIEECWDATEEFSRDDQGHAGFIAPVGKGPVKGGKPSGVPYNFGTEQWHEGQRKNA